MAFGEGNLEQALALTRLEFLKRLESAGVKFETWGGDGLIILTTTEVLDYLENPDATLAKHSGVPLEVWLQWKEWCNSNDSIPLHEFISNPPKPKQNRVPKPLIPDQLRWEVWERDNFTCQQCGKRSNLTIDHIIPVSKGGQTVKDNLQTLCKICNSKKGVTEKPLHDEVKQCHEPNPG